MEKTRYVINACWRDWVTGMPSSAHDVYHGLTFTLEDALQTYDAVIGTALRECFPRRNELMNIAKIDIDGQSHSKSERLVYRVEIRRHENSHASLVKEWQMPFVYWKQLTNETSEKTNGIKLAGTCQVGTAMSSHHHPY